jgi:predicted PurR-regulated permease PerM
MFLPFFKIIALGAILAILFYPLKLRVARQVNSETATSLITFVLALLIVLIPLYIIGQLLFNEISGIYFKASSGGMSFSQETFLNSLPGSVRTALESVLNNAGEKISGFAGNALQSVTALASNVVGFLVDFVLVCFTFYYFLRDGHKFWRFMENILPLSKKHESLLEQKLDTAVKGVVQGSFTVALLQGIIAAIGFLIFGVPSAFLWGAFTVLAALVPNFGTALSLIPAVLYLLITGHTGAAIGMAIWGGVAVGTIDNVLGPKLVGARADLHPLVALFSVVGGISLFGVLGFLLGPILAAVFIALLDIYRAGMQE